MKITLRRAMPATLLLVGITATMLTSATGANAAPLELRSRITLPEGEQGDIATDPLADRVYVTNQHNKTVVTVDTITDSVIGSPITVPAGATRLALNPNTQQLAVSAQDNPTLSVIDLTTATIKTIDLTYAVDCMSYNTNTNELWVSHSADNLVSVIDLNASPAKVLATLPVGLFPTNLVVDKILNRIYVSNNGSSSVSILNGSTRTVEDTLRMHGQPTDIALNSATNTVYIAGSDGLDVFDGLRKTFIARDLETPDGQKYFDQVAVDPLTRKVFVTNTLSSSLLWTLDENTQDFIPGSVVYLDGLLPHGLAIRPATGEIFSSAYDPATRLSAVSVVEQRVKPNISPRIISADPPAAIIRVDYSFQLAVKTGSPVTYRVSSGRLPWGLDLDPTTGEIYGTPTGFFGPFVNTFTITAANAYGTTNATYTIVTRVIP